MAPWTSPLAPKKPLCYRMHVVLFREYGMSSCLGASLRSENAEEDQPLTVITLAQRPVLRTWRLTPGGLVEIIDENRAQMGAFLDKPKTAKTNCSGQGNVSGPFQSHFFIHALTWNSYPHGHLFVCMCVFFCRVSPSLIRGNLTNIEICVQCGSKDLP